jgi:hypothetical protein
MLTFELDAVDFEAEAAGKAGDIIAALTARLDNLNVELASRTAASIGSLLDRRTGSAASSVEVQASTVTQDLIEGSVTAGGDSAPYLIFQEEGTAGPYPIYPVRAAALAFELGGRLVLAQKVIHPGVKARKPVATAFEQFTPDILEGLDDAVGEAVA